MDLNRIKRIKSIASNLAGVLPKIKNSSRKNQKRLVVFIDLRKVYDSIDRKTALKLV